MLTFVRLEDNCGRLRQLKHTSATISVEHAYRQQNDQNTAFMWKIDGFLKVKKYPTTEYGPPHQASFRTQ